MPAHSVTNEVSGDAMPDEVASLHLVQPAEQATEPALAEARSWGDAFLAKPAVVRARQPIEVPAGLRLWTDDYSSLFPIIQLSKKRI